RVKEGDLLLRLESPELQKQLKGLQAEYREATTKVGQLILQISRSRVDERPQLQSQREESEIKADGARQQIEVIQEQLGMLEVRAPQDGIITTWEVKKNLLGRPVEVGQELVQVAATGGDWVLEVDVPDDDMGPILAAES